MIAARIEQLREWVDDIKGDPIYNLDGVLLLSPDEQRLIDEIDFLEGLLECIT